MVLDFTAPNLLVIGNGFDLNLGLKTGYTDFIKSSNFNNILEKNNLCQYLKENHDLNNWIDIERELKYYSIMIDGSSNEYGPEFAELSNALKEYIRSLDLKDINYKSQAFVIFEKLLNEDLNIINFNYTETISELAVRTYSRGEKLKDHIKIHGSVKDDNIIFGVEDSGDIQSRHVFIRKSFAKNFGKYSVQNYLHTAPSVTFFGLSIGESDHSHFEDFFRNCCTGAYNTKEVVFYYYGHEGYTNLMQQIEVLTLRQLGKFKNSVKVEFRDLKG